MGPRVISGGTRGLPWEEGPALLPRLDQEARPFGCLVLLGFSVKHGVICRTGVTLGETCHGN